MDWSKTYWPQVGAGVALVCAIVFIAAAMKRQWSVAALLVAILHLPITLVHVVAPFRGALDPTYPGYVQGLVHADKGIEVAIFTSFMLFGGLACVCIALLNRGGPRNYFMVGYDSLLVLTLLPASLGALATRGFAGFNVAFGEYLQFSGFPAFLFEVLLLLTPPVIGIVWAWRRARDGEAI